MSSSKIFFKGSRFRYRWVPMVPFWWWVGVGASIYFHFLNQCSLVCMPVLVLPSHSTHVWQSWAPLKFHCNFSEGGREVWISRAGKAIVKLKKKKYMRTSLPLCPECAQTSCFFFAVVKLPKRWWRPAPRSRGSLRRYTGRWGDLWGSGKLQGWTEGFQACFAKFYTSISLYQEGA